MTRIPFLHRMLAVGRKHVAYACPTIHHKMLWYSSSITRTFPLGTSNTTLDGNDSSSGSQNAENERKDDDELIRLKLKQEKLRAMFGESRVSKGKPTKSLNEKPGEAEKAWEDSQYIDYMSRQREKGWKT